MRLKESITVKRIISLMIMLSLILFYTSIPAEAKSKDGIKLSMTSCGMVIGESKTIKVKNISSGATVNYKSNNKKVASVNKKGKIIGNKAGTANITVTVKERGKKQNIKCKVKVKKPSLSEKKCEIREKKSKKLSIKNKPKKAAYSWKSSNTSVATVKKGKITAKKAGTVKVSVTVKGKGFKYNLSVPVKVKGNSNSTDTGLDVNPGDTTVETDGEVTIIKTKTNDAFEKAAAEMIKDAGAPGKSLTKSLDEFASRRLIVRSSKEIDFTILNKKCIVVGNENLYLVQFESVSDAKQTYESINELDSVEWVEPDQYVTVEDMQANSKSWGVDKMHADVFAQSLSDIQTEVVVSVVDTGVSDHAFLNGRINGNGYDFVDVDDDPSDQHYHGTHVAGTVVDCTPGLNINILPVRVLDASGGGSYFNVASGVVYAADHGANVINLSLGGSHSNLLDEKIDYAIDKGVSVCIAAGNEGSNTSYYCPAHIENESIIVAAIDQGDSKAYFSNYGDSVDVAAPGVGIESCVPGGRYKSLSGTSMATPHIAAVAAMFKLQNPSADPGEIEQLVKGSCRDLGDSGWDKYYGYGVPNLASADSDEPTGISLDRDTVNLVVGSSIVLKATVRPEKYKDSPILWESSDGSIALVEDGIVTAYEAGSATITASTVNGYTASCEVFVTDSAVEPTSIELDKSNVSIGVNDNIQIKATVYPSNAADKSVNWHSEDEGIATVDNGKINGLSSGSTRIVATTSNGLETYCTVNVIAKSILPTKITLDKNSSQLDVGQSMTLGYTISPDNATDKTVSWTSDDKSVAVVDSYGKVTAKAVGRAVISVATVNGKGATCLVTVVPKDKLTLNYSDVSVYADNHDSISLFNIGTNGGGKTIITDVGESVQAGININFAYNNVPGLQLKAYLNGNEIDASQVTWKSSYAPISGNGYLSGSSNGGFVTMSVAPVERSSTVTAVWKNDSNVKAEAHVTFVYDAKMRFSIKDTSIASVDSRGVVTGKKTGGTTLTMKSDLTGKSISCPVYIGKPATVEAEMVYTDGNSGIKKLGCYGNNNYVSVSSTWNFYIKVPIDSELSVDSYMELAAQYNPHSYDTGGIKWNSNSFYKGGYSYYNVTPKIYYQSGKIKLYFQINLANGQVIHAINMGTDDCFFLDITD